MIPRWTRESFQFCFVQFFWFYVCLAEVRLLKLRKLRQCNNLILSSRLLWVETIQHQIKSLSTIVILQIYYLSQIPVTTWWFELQTICVQRSFLITSTMIYGIYSQFTFWCSHWNLWSIMSLVQDISKLYSTLRVEIAMGRKSRKSCEIIFRTFKIEICEY